MVKIIYRDQTSETIIARDDVAGENELHGNFASDGSRTAPTHDNDVRRGRSQTANSTTETRTKTKDGLCGSIKLLFGRDRSRNAIIWAIIGWTFAVTIARAIRMPNDFSEAHWLLDYRFGFIKRGLIGSLCSIFTRLLGCEMNPHIILALSVVMVFSMYAAMLVIFYRSFRRNQPRDSLFAIGLVFASSPFVVMNAHLLGYFDAILYLFTIASVALTLHNRPFLASLISVVAILSHESYLLIGFPLVCLASVTILISRRQHARWSTYIVALCIPVLAFIAIALIQSLTTDALTLRGQIAEHLHAFGIDATGSKKFSIWQTTTFMQFFRRQIWNFGEHLLHPAVLAAVGPSLLAILVYIYSSFKIRIFSLFSIFLFCVICAPLAMHAVAWDTARISTYTIGGTFIAAWILSETRVARKTHDAFFLIAINAVILNSFARILLMDGEVERFSDISRMLIYLPAILLVIIIAASKAQKSSRQTGFPISYWRRRAGIGGG